MADYINIDKLAEDFIECYKNGSNDEAEEIVIIIKEKFMTFYQSITYGSASQAALTSIETFFLRFGNILNAACEESEHSLEQVKILMRFVQEIRNEFSKGDFFAQIVPDNEHFGMSLIKFCLTVIEDIFEKQLTNNSHRNDSNELSILIEDLWSTAITLLSNMSAKYVKGTAFVFPRFKSYIVKMLSHPSFLIGHKASSVLNNFLLKETTRKQITQDEVNSWLPLTLHLYTHKTDYDFFPSLCCRTMISNYKIQHIFLILKPIQQLLCLDFMSCIVNEKNNGDSPLMLLENVIYVKELYKKATDQIFQSKNSNDLEMLTITPNVLTRIVFVLCRAADCELFSQYLRDDKSLLISTVYMLKGVNDSEMSKEVLHVREQSNDIDEDRKHESNWGQFNLKSDLVRLIALLTYRHKENQDLVCDLNAISILLQSSRSDAHNPYARECSIFAIKVILENNLKNQNYVKNLKLSGVAPNKGLEELGLEAVIDDMGQLTITQKGVKAMKIEDMKQTAMNIEDRELER